MPVALTAPEGVLSPKLYVDVPARPQKLDFLYTNFLHNYPPISTPFWKENHPICLKLGAFYHNLLKIHPIYVIWAPSFLMKTQWSLYQISRNSTPKGRHIHVYHVNVRTPSAHTIQCTCPFIYFSYTWNKSLTFSTFLIPIKVTFEINA